MWVNPRLDIVPDDNDALFLPFRRHHLATDQDQTFTFDRIRLAKDTRSEENGTVDEFRLGEVFGDVAPIVGAGFDGDFDGDNDVDGADFLEWQRNLGDSANLALWETNYGTTGALSAVTSVPEPTALLLASVMAVTLVSCRRRKS